MWIGVPVGQDPVFRVPNDYEFQSSRMFIGDDGKKYMSMGYIKWYTNLDHPKREEKLILFRKYAEEDYPKYQNYDAIEVSKVKDIPKDYFGEMGVPLTFLDKHNPRQFEIVGLDRYVESNTTGRRFMLNGKELYVRIVIRRVQEGGQHGN